MMRALIFKGATDSPGAGKLGKECVRSYDPRNNKNMPLPFVAVRT